MDRRRADQLALADALGETAESRRRQDELDLEASELRALLERGSTDRDQLLATERVAGLGAAPAQRHARVDKKVVEEEARQAKEKRMSELIEADAARRACRDPHALNAPTSDFGFVTSGGAAAAVGASAPGGGGAKRDRDERKAEKRAAKKAKKAERKALKKAKKESKRAKRDDSD